MITFSSDSIPDLFSWPSGLTHAMTEWDTLNQEWELLYQQGDYNRATVVAEKALQTAEQTRNRTHSDIGIESEQPGIFV